MNEYNIAVQAFALQGSMADQTQWMDAIKKAQVLNNNHGITPLLSLLSCSSVIISVDRHHSGSEQFQCLISVSSLL